MENWGPAAPLWTVLEGLALLQRVEKAVSAEPRALDFQACVSRRRNDLPPPSAGFFQREKPCAQQCSAPRNEGVVSAVLFGLKWASSDVFCVLLFARSKGARHL